MRRLCVIGDPVLHSKSPLIQSAMMKAVGAEGEYLCQPVKAEDLPDFLAALRRGEWSGCNVTMPHKGAVIPHLDQVEEGALRCGAVNTICNRDGKLYGFSTDGGGFLRALAQAGVEVRGRTFTLLGAGGAARSVAWALARAGARRLYAANRTPARAEELCQLDPAVMEPHGFDAATLRRLAGESEVLVNATSLGMGGAAGQFEDFGFVEALPPHAAVFDLIYHPARTELLRRAEERGLLARNGLDMLLYQGLLALEQFLDRPVDPALAVPAARAALAEAGN